jgi:nitrogen fixation protein NifU and related proteins
MSSDFEHMYREVILDHYKHPHNYGTIDEPHAHAEGQNPLCGDEVSIDLTFDGSDKITDVKLSGRGCAI